MQVLWTRKSGREIRWASGGWLTAVALALGLVMASGNVAASDGCPVPLAKSGKVRIGVFGDSVARGYWRGLKRAFANDQSVVVVRHAKSATGLVRDDVYNWQRALKKIGRYDIAVVSIGGNDRQNFRVNGRRIDRGSKPWVAEYRRRVSRYMRALKKTGARVYWVGLPIVRSKRMDRDFKSFNKLYRAMAEREGIEFIDTSKLLRDGDGGFSAFGKMPAGGKGRLRKPDGTHFTRQGNDFMAHYIRSRLCAKAQVVGAN